MSAASIAGLVVTNSSLLVAVLVYMGWAYTNAMWEYFHLNPLDLGVGVVEYTLRGLDLFSPAIVILAVLFIAGHRRPRLGPGPDPVHRRVRARPWIRSWAVTRGWHPRAQSGSCRTGRGVMIAAGMAVTVTGLALAWLARRASASPPTFC